MGYEVYITRANSWLHAKEKPISEAEWHAVVEADESLSINTTDYYEYKLASGGRRRTHPVEWSDAEDGNCLWYKDGAISCKNPSKDWVAKMVELAELLNANVVGEEDELYT